MKYIYTLTATILALPGTATADTITVCESGCDYDNVLHAVQAAQSGDVIEVGPGVWEFNIENGDDGCGFQSPADECNFPAVTLRGSVGTDGKPTTKIYKCLLRVVEDTIFENIQFGVSFTDNFNGFYMQEASPTFTNCVFYNCNRTTEGEYGEPESIFPIFGSSPIFDNCDFTAMGGLTDESTRATLFRISESRHEMENPGQPSDPVFTNCNFRDCGASNTGLIFCQSRGSFVDCTFEDNSSASSLFYVRANEQLLIKGCTFTSNTANPGITSGGAAIYISSSANDVRIESCQFTKNYSTRRGGAVCSSGGSPELIDCMFTGNVADESGGAIYCSAIGLTLANCQFSSNFPDAIAGPFATTHSPHLAGDVNDDGIVDHLDVTALKIQIGSCQGDTNGNGTVDVLDLLEVIAAWGTCP